MRLRYIAAVEAAITVALMGTTGFAAEPPALEVEIQTKYAYVSGQDQAEAVLGRVGAAIDEAVPRIAPLVGTADLRPVRARVYLDRRQFSAATGMPAGSRIVGLAVLPEGVIHVDGTGVLSSIEKVVPHEVGHVLIGRALGPALQALPLWVNEGTAEYMAGERAAQADPAALRAIGRGRGMSLEELDSAIASRGADAGIAYAQAASLVNFLVDQHGEAVIAALLQSLRETGDFSASLDRVTGLTTAQLETSWRESVSRRWRWILLFQSPAPIFALMLLLFLVGVIRFYREKRRRQEMPDDDW